MTRTRRKFQMSGSGTLQRKHRNSSVAALGDRFDRSRAVILGRSVAWLVRRSPDLKASYDAARSAAHSRFMIRNCDSGQPKRWAASSAGCQASGRSVVRRAGLVCAAKNTACGTSNTFEMLRI